MIYRARHAVSTWQFWITLAFFTLGALFVLQTTQNSQRVEDNAKAIRQACLSGNAGRAASRAAWNKVEAYIVIHSRDAKSRQASMSFFDAVFGPSGQRARPGKNHPLADRNCN